MSKSFDIITKAGDLMDYTMTITTNKKRYPSKYIELAKRIQNKSMDIYEYIMEANRLDINIEKEDRIKLQTKVITTCDKLSRFAEMSMSQKLIGSDTVCYWQKKINDVKYMTIAWREKDKVR